MTELIQTNLESSHLDSETALALKNHFAPFEQQATEWKERAEQLVVTDVSQTELIASAREARLSIRKIRLAVTNKHQELKEDSLKKGQALDKIKRVLLGLIEPIEEHLQQQEDFVKIKLEEQAKQLFAERADQLKPYMAAEMIAQMSLVEMNQDVFNSFLNGQRLAHEAKIEAERKEAEQKLKEQKAKEAEEEKTRKQNQKLQEEKAKLEAKLKKEREEKRKLEQEQKDREEKAEQERKAKQAAERKLKRAPDKVKLLALADKITDLHLEYVNQQMKDDDSSRVLRSALKGLYETSVQLTLNANNL